MFLLFPLPLQSSFLWGSMTQWLARLNRDPAVVDSIPTTAHVVRVIATEKRLTYISFNPRNACPTD